MTEILPDLTKILQAAGEQVVKDIVNAQGIKGDYLVSVENLPDYDIAIKAGYPPELIISYSLLLEAIFNQDEKIRKSAKKKFRSVLARAIAKLRVMERSLALQPMAEIIAVKHGMSKFVKSNFPEKLVYRIPDNHLRFSIQHNVTVTVTETYTGMTVTLVGDSESYLRAKAVSQLTQMLQMHDGLAEELEKENIEPKPNALYFKEGEIKSEY